MLLSTAIISRDPPDQVSSIDFPYFDARERAYWPGNLPDMLALKMISEQPWCVYLSCPCIPSPESEDNISGRTYMAHGFPKASAKSSQTQIFR